MGELRGSDIAVVRDQLGREPTTSFTVVARCPDGHPLVIRNEPVDAHGDPFPRTFWLTCPTAVKAVSRLESAGCDRSAERASRGRPDFADALVAAHEAYAAEAPADAGRADAPAARAAGSGARGPG